MKVQKYKHACFTVEIDGKILVVDPGNFSDDFIAPEHVAAVVITHDHGDHFDMEQLAMITDKNPDALILGPASAMSSIEAFNCRTVSVGDTVDVGPFHVSFSGGSHATIHESMPTPENLGVMINDLLYYPGDSLFVPDQPVDCLALPAAAPWMKIGEAMDYLTTVQPRFAFPTHDAILSKSGQSMVDRMLGGVAQSVGTVYQRIDAEPIDV